MLDTLGNWDRSLFLLLNGAHSPAWDAVMWRVSETATWIPLFVALAGYLAFVYRGKALWVLVGAAVLVGISDQASVHLFKEVFERPRPCHQPDLAPLVHLVNGHCGGRFGFVSTHACNAFSLAVFTALWVRRWWCWFALLLWAVTIGYSRIYLGVHFPGDVIAGALVGSSLACGMYAMMIHFKPLRGRLPRQL